MASESSPAVTPSFVVVNKEESVVVVFKNSFASSQGPIILDFFDEAMQKVGSSSCYQLAPNIIQVQFPALSKPGMVEAVPRTAQESSSLFPKFNIYVASLVEAMFNRLPCDRAQDKQAILSCILAYITHLSSEEAQNAKQQADTIICKLLSSMPEISQWDLATFLCGGHETHDNLLQFAIRYRLDGMAENLAQHIPKNKEVLWQVSSDKMTPLDMAKKNGMVNIVNTLKRFLASYGVQENLSASDDESSSSTTASISPKVSSSGGIGNDAFVLKALNDISRQYLYKAKVTQDYQWLSSFPHEEEISLKMGDTVYVTQEKNEELCMGVANLSYGEFPKHVLQQVMSLGTDGMNNMTSPTKPVPKPRITSGSTALHNSSEVEPNVLSSKSGTESHASTLAPTEASTICTVVPGLEIPSDSNTTGSTLPTAEVPPPVSPRLRRVQSESTSIFSLMLQTESVPSISTTPTIASVPSVSPRLKRLQLDDIPRIRTDSAPTVSPRLHRKQIDHNLKQQEGNVSPMLQTDNASPVSPPIQMAGTPPVSPRLKRPSTDNSSRMRTESAPAVSPRLLRLQIDSTSTVRERMQENSTPPASPQLHVRRLQVDKKPLIGPKPQIDGISPTSPGLKRPEVQISSSSGL